MKIEEAIRILKNDEGYDVISPDADKAIKLAIRSLEAWDEVDYLVNKTYWGFPIGLDYCLDRLTEIMKEVADEHTDSNFLAQITRR